MGCILCKFYSEFCTKKADESCLVPEPKKEYSWDKKPKFDPKDFTIEGIIDSEIVREPKTVNGRQMIVQNCKNSKIFVLDHCNSVIIDDCTDCQIILGPSSGSLFVRGSENLCLIALCGQFRARDCRNLTAFLCCTSQPSIEACSKLDFGCALIQYKQLQGQIEKSGLSIFNNQWNLIYDFTPIASDDPNWQIIPADKVTELVQISEENAERFELVIGEKSKSLVPCSLGSSDVENYAAEICIVAITEFRNQESIFALEFIASLNHEAHLRLTRTKEAKVSDEEMKKLNPNQKKLDASLVNLIVLQFTGSNCVTKCQEAKEKGSTKFGEEMKENVHIYDRPSGKQLITFMQSS
ncbi:Hypothetical predicted protein [Cloeon dipterum]|uniref:Protein XRP2 n=1 Tax=Cloeon dipterum TaxID=197152 RepID=A0A8S1CXW0_9INSE|nr:Hypothetical predicted protein [Cloeon dipterum]